MSKNIVVTEKAETAKSVELCWQARNEQEALNLVQWLKDHGIKAKAVELMYCKNYK